MKANAEGGAKQESKSRREEAKEPRSKRERHNDAAGELLDHRVVYSSSDSV